MPNPIDSRRCVEAEIVLECGGRKCCPTITFYTDGGARLVDDDGESVVLSADQVAALRVHLDRFVGDK